MPGSVQITDEYGRPVIKTNSLGETVFIVVPHSYERWTGSGTGNAPTGMPYNIIGFDGDDVGYEYTPSGGWVAVTGLTFPLALGVPV